VHSIVNPLFYRPRSREEKDALRRRYGITGQLAVYVGRRAPYKNVTALLRAVKLLRLQKRDLKLLLAGDPDGYHPEQEMRASGEHPDEYAFFPGFLLPVELATLYQTADVLVFPSELEGFGLPPLEAMASGTPVVCSTCEVLRETAGTAALFTEPAPEALANAIGRVIDNPDLRSDLIQRGWEQAALYSPDSAAESILGIYRRLTSVG
jgi:glycosyltransferase involved in cell wall biosynthesis